MTESVQRVPSGPRRVQDMWPMYLRTATPHDTFHVSHISRLTAHVIPCSSFRPSVAQTQHHQIGVVDDTCRCLSRKTSAGSMCDLSRDGTMRYGRCRARYSLNSQQHRFSIIRSSRLVMPIRFCRSFIQGAQGTIDATDLYVTQPESLLHCGRTHGFRAAIVTTFSGHEPLVIPCIL